MPRFLFATYEFHPTTWGGCGVLLRHATDLLLEQGHQVDLLLDVPKPFFDRFVARDLETLSVPEYCRAHHADALCEDLEVSPSAIRNPFVWKSLRFAHAIRTLVRRERFDFVEFFEYCGVGYHTLVEKRFGLHAEDPILGIRVHNSVELIDLHEGRASVDRERAVLYGLERGALGHAESVLFPSMSYAERYCLDRYALSPEAIAISEPPTAPFGRRPSLPETERREIQFYGRIFEFKGVERFVRAALLLLEARPELDVDFVLIGNDSHDGAGGGSYRKYLEGTIPARFRDRFDFTGHLDHEAARERFGRARFAVFPNRFESFCYAFHEVYEAGVPLVVADIPAFRNYLEDGRDALFFDGSSVDLMRQMGRLLDEPGLGERIAPQGRLAQDPLGDFYANPKHLRPIPLERGDSVRLMIVILVPERASQADWQRTIAAIRPSLAADDQLVLAFGGEDPRASSGAEESGPTPEPGSAIEWLGEPRRMCSDALQPLFLSGLRTRDALWVLLAGDEPATEFLPLCRGALERNRTMGFAGTWSRTAEGAIEADCFDVVPERLPFDAGARLSRCLVRTQPDALLVEALDTQAGIYGEIGALWRAEEAWGPGCLLPRPMLKRSAFDDPARNAGQLAFLIQSVASPARRERLALLALDRFSDDRQDAASQIAPDAAPLPHDPDGVRRIAADALDGTTLARMAMGKLARKIVAALTGRLPGRDPGDRG